MILVGCGDSWAWGAELIDKQRFPDWKFGDNYQPPGNELHRLKHRYLNLFAEKINAEKIVCLERCSYSNDAIVRTLIDYLVTNDYTSGRDTSELFISIGWTSPERREFFYKKPWGGTDHWIPFGSWPMGNSKQFPELEEFRNLFMENFWNAGEYINRWVRQIWQTELMLKHYNIKYVMHQAFYHHHHQMIYEWDDKKYYKNTEDKITAADKKMWASIDPIRYINKDHESLSTFHHVILDKVGGDTSKVFAEWHPNELGHRLWADYMYEYCKEHQLI